MSYPFFSRTVLAFAVLLTSLLVGCNEPVVPTGTLTGTVSSGGQPYNDCKVQIVQVGTSRSKGSKVENGKFKFVDLKFGDYDIAVHQLADPFTTAEIPFDKKIPKKYRSVKTSGLRVSVPTAEEVVFDFNLE